MSFGHTADVACSRLLFVGENNPQSEDKRHALYPHNSKAAGARLMGILGLQRSTYLSVWRTNLCGGYAKRGSDRVMSETWDSKDAMHRALDLTCVTSPPWSTIVLLGRKVGSVALINRPKFFEMSVVHGTTFVCLPHPSGLCREWNDPINHELARAIMRSAAPGVPFGEVMS